MERIYDFWADRQVSVDAVGLYVVRYTFDVDGLPSLAEHVTEDGWVPHGENHEVAPVFLASPVTRGNVYRRLLSMDSRF